MNVFLLHATTMMGGREWVDTAWGGHRAGGVAYIFRMHVPSPEPIQVTVYVAYPLG